MATPPGVGDLPSRRNTYSFLTGVVSALLAVGLLLPYLIGEPIGGTTTAAPVIDDLTGGDATTGGSSLGEPLDDGGSAGTTTSSGTNSTSSTTTGATTTTPSGTTGSTTGTTSSGTTTGTTTSSGTTTTTTPGTTTGGTTQDTQPADPQPAATSSAAPDNGNPQPQPTAAPPAQNTASDTGVTADSIKVAIMVADLGNAEDLGFEINTGDAKLSYQVFIDEVNEAGGINGRTIDPVYLTFDPLDQDDMRRACIDATENEQVFAVFNQAGYYGAAILCLTEEHGTPYMTTGQHEPDEWYARSGGLYVSYLPSKSRQLVTMVKDLDALGLLEGRTIGVVDSGFTADKLASEQSLLPTIDALGYEVAHRATIPEAADQAAAQIPIEIENMRREGVDTILFAVNFLVQRLWVTQADQRGYTPRYHVSDMGGGTSDDAADDFPASYDGTVAFTSLRTGEERAGLPEPAVDQECRATYEARSGTATPRGSVQATSANGACQVIRDFARAAASQGANLTQAGMASAFASLGSFEVAGFPTGSLGPGKFDAVDGVRTIQWKFDCRCWQVASDYRRFQ